MEERGPLQTLGLSVLEVRATRVLLQLLILQRDSHSEPAILYLLRHSHFEVVHETLATLERIMKGNIDGLSDTIEDIVPHLKDGTSQEFDKYSVCIHKTIAVVPLFI